jgi:hypothetical protein
MRIEHPSRDGYSILYKLFPVNPVECLDQDLVLGLKIFKSINPGNGFLFKCSPNPPKSPPPWLARPTRRQFSAAVQKP